MNPTELDRSFYSTAELPDKNAHVIVICRTFRCLGLLDSEGIWRDAFSRDKLDDVIGWQQFE